MSSDTGGMIPFPPGNNDTDTAFGGGHFNLTALKDLDYHLFENGTVSNHSRCLLAFEPHTPAYFFPNGTWVNYTSCYTAIYPIGTRAQTGVGLGAWPSSSSSSTSASTGPCTSRGRSASSPSAGGGSGTGGP